MTLQERTFTRTAILTFVRKTTSGASTVLFCLSFVANAFFVAIDALFKKKIINDKVTMVFIHIYLKSRKWSVTYLKQMIKSSAGFILMMESLRELLCQHLLFICEIFNKIKKINQYLAKFWESPFS